MADPASDMYNLKHFQRHAVLEQLTSLCTAVSASTDVDTVVTAFHSSEVPRISLCRYNYCIMKRLKLQRPCFGVAVVLIYRYWAHSGSKPSMLTIHRLLTAALLVGMKVYHERVITNARFAAVCGLGLAELNYLETALLKGVGWATFVALNDLQSVLGALLRVPAFACSCLALPRIVGNECTHTNATPSSVAACCSGRVEESAH